MCSNPTPASIQGLASITASVAASITAAQLQFHWLRLQDNQPQQAGSPSLANALSALAAAFLKTASLSLGRTTALVEGLPALTAAAPVGDSAAPGAAAAAERAQQGLRPLLLQAGGTVQAAREAAAAVGSKLALAEDGAVPSLAVAQVSAAM